MIQGLYLFTSKGSFTPLVLISMAFTTMSLLVAFLSQLSRISQLLRKREKKFLNMDRVTFRMIIKCNELQTHHAFSHQKLEQCLDDVFDTDKTLSDLHHRKDVSLTTEVYNIKERTKLKQTLIVVFESVILTQDLGNGAVGSDSERKLILEAIKNIGVDRHGNNREMINVCIFICLIKCLF